MPKLIHGAARSSGSKKKTKKRAESAPIAQISPSAGARQPVQPEGRVSENSNATVIQFRPRSRVAGPAKLPGRPAGPAKAFLQTVDYSYVYTDLRIIGMLALALFAVLIVLSFLLR
jgi:hypothetical protein